MASIDHDDQARTRVAIIGTGLAGLATAHLLANDVKHRYSVTLFEQANELSFDSASIVVQNNSTGDAERVDLPMRASAGGYYANLMRMYEYLDVPLHPVRFLFVFAKALSSAASQRNTNAQPTNQPESVCSAPGTYFVHASNLHQTPPPWPGTRGAVAHIVEILYLIVCHFWFSVACFLISPRAPTSWASGDGGESLDDYLYRIWLPQRYVSHYLLPLLSSVSTCSHEELLDFPASDVINYKKLSHGQQHYAVCGGVSQVQMKLAKGVDDVRLGAQVMQVSPIPDQDSVVISWRSISDESGHVLEQGFDRVVLAVSPDVVCRIFKPLASKLSIIPTVRVESSILSTKDTVPTHSIVDVAESTSMHCMHHDGSKDGSTAAQIINLRTRFSDDGAETEALHTMPSGVVVSTCPLDGSAPPDKRMLHTAKFTRTLRTTESRAVMESILSRRQTISKKTDNSDEGWVNGQDNVWLTGAWCWDGMVLLEGCIVSAMRVADDFGVPIPWKQ